MENQPKKGYRLPDAVQPYTQHVINFGPWAALAVWLVLPLISIFGMFAISGFKMFTNLGNMFKSSAIGGILVIAMLVLPILLIVMRKTKPEIMRWLALAIALCPIALAIALPTGIGPAWGTWIYFLVGIAIAAVEFQSK